MTQVNLLPSDVRQRLKTRQLTILVGMVGAIVVAALLFFFVLQSGKLASANNDLAAAKATNNALQTQINSLTTDFINRSDPAQRSVIEQNRQKALSEFARLQNDIEKDKKAIADFEEEARRAGVPPGWLR